MGAGDKVVRISTGALIAILVILFSTTLLSLVFYDYTAKNILHTFATQWEYEPLTYVAMNYAEVGDIVEYCYPFQGKDQVDCVVGQVNDTYTDHNSSDPTFSNPELIQGDGPRVCRDYAIMMNAIFKKLGWTTDFDFSLDHVWVEIYKYDGDDMTHCDISNALAHCW